jgi:hypothetical protein
MAWRNGKITGSCDKKKYPHGTPHAGKIYPQSEQKRNLRQRNKIISLKAALLKVRWGMTKLQSKHAEHNGIKNDLGIKKLDPNMNDDRPGHKAKKLANAGTIPIRRRGNEFELCVVTSRRS